MKLFSFVTGAIIGFGVILFTSRRGTELRRILFDSNYEWDRDGDPHTYNIKELISRNSDSLEEIKDRLD